MEKQMGEVTEGRVRGQFIQRVCVALAIPMVVRRHEMREPQHAPPAEVRQADQTVDVVLLAQEGQLLNVRHPSYDVLQTVGRGMTPPDGVLLVEIRMKI